MSSPSVSSSSSSISSNFDEVSRLLLSQSVKLKSKSVSDGVLPKSISNGMLPEFVRFKYESASVAVVLLGHTIKSVLTE